MASAEPSTDEIMAGVAQSLRLDIHENGYVSDETIRLVASWAPTDADAARLTRALLRLRP